MKKESSRQVCARQMHLQTDTCTPRAPHGANDGVCVVFSAGVLPTLRLQ